jgi:hypothetical protein
MANHLSLSVMVQAMLQQWGMSERELGRAAKASQSTIHRIKSDPTYRASDEVGQRLRAMYRRRKPPPPGDSAGDPDSGSAAASLSH